MQFTSIIAVFALASLSAAYPLEIRAARGGNSTNAASASAVTTAAQNFVDDATTVSASLNTMNDQRNRFKVAALAKKAFDAETDEDAQRAVLSAAGGADAAASNAKIVKNTPIVLDGLASIMKNPSPANTKSQIATMEAAR